MKKFSAAFSKALAADIQGDDLQGHLPAGYASRLIYILGFASQPETLLKNVTAQIADAGWRAALDNDADALNKHIAVYRYTDVMVDHLSTAPDAESASPAMKETSTETAFRDWVQDQEDKAAAARAADAAMVKAVHDLVNGLGGIPTDSLSKAGTIGDDAPDVGMGADEFLDMIRKLPGVRVIKMNRRDSDKT